LPLFVLETGYFLAVMSRLVGEFVCQVISMGSIALFGGVKKLLLRIYLWAKIIICLDEI
jgi:hypothetical protein